MSDTGSSKWEKIAMIVVAFLVGLSVISYLNVRLKMNQARARVQVADLQTAVQAFAREYGFLPQGDAAAILAALRGHSSRRVLFYETDPRFINPKGEIIDPWGAPVRFDLSNPTEPHIWSTGRNRRDDHAADGSDDIPSWK